MTNPNPFDDLPPGLVFVDMRHDAWCPTLASGNGNDCQCRPEVAFTDEKRFVRTVVQGRRERRKAEREAAKALRRAAKRSAGGRP